MDSRTTVADIRTAMARFNLTDAEFLRRLNRVTQRMLTSDVFYDIMSVVEVTTSTGYFTLDRRYGRAYGVQIGDYAKPVRDQWFEFVELGVGRQDPSSMTIDGIESMGNHFATDLEIWTGGAQVAAPLRLTITNAADAGKTFRFSGTFIDTDGVEKRVIDANGAEGINLASVNATADTTVAFRVVDGIQAPSGLKGMWYLSKVIATVPTQIGMYYPDETRPRRIRYKTAQTTETIRLFCRRKFITLLNDTDFVYPDNIDAIEQGFMALTFRDKGDTKAELGFWEAAKQVLKEEYASTVPYPRIQLTSDFPGARGRSGAGPWFR